jgi:hypothetical protein
MARILVWTFTGLFLLLLATGCVSPSVNTTPAVTNTPLPPTNLTFLEYTRIYADVSGETHFDTVRVNETLALAAPPAPPLYVSAESPARQYLFYTFPPGWIGDLHPSPARQFLVQLSGKVEVETSDGTVRQFEPGAFILLEDTQGKGHKSKNIGEGYLHYVVVQIPEP